MNTIMTRSEVNREMSPPMLRAIADALEGSKAPLRMGMIYFESTPEIISGLRKLADETEKNQS